MESERGSVVQTAQAGEILRVCSFNASGSFSLIEPDGPPTIMSQSQQ